MIVARELYERQGTRDTDMRFGEYLDLANRAILKAQGQSVRTMVSQDKPKGAYR